MSNVPTGTVDVEEILGWLQTDRFMGKRESAHYLGMGEKKFRAQSKSMPKYKVGGTWVFKRSELDEWMEQYRVQPTAEDVSDLVDGVLAEVGAELGSVSTAGGYTIHNSCPARRIALSGWFISQRTVCGLTKSKKLCQSGSPRSALRKC